MPAAAQQRSESDERSSDGGGRKDAHSMDWRKTQRNWLIAQLCGRPIMLADTKVREWDWNQMIEEDYTELVPHTWFIHGKTRTGKTFWTRWMLYHLRHVFAFGWVFCHTKVRRMYKRQ